MVDHDMSVNHRGLPVVTLAQAPLNEFVAYWRRGYSYASEELYTSNIGRPLTRRRLEELFEWKNGSKLSRGKRESVERNYVGRYSELSHLPVQIPLNDLLERFGGGAIWRIFFLHCWRPEAFPIYDQHVHRAMEYIETGAPREIAASTPKILGDYARRYLPFWRRFQPQSGRDADKALWVFGKFLKGHSWLLAPQVVV